MFPPSEEGFQYNVNHWPLIFCCSLLFFCISIYRHMHAYKVEMHAALLLYFDLFCKLWKKKTLWTFASFSSFCRTCKLLCVFCCSFWGNTHGRFVNLAQNIFPLRLPLRQRLLRRRQPVPPGTSSFSHYIICFHFPSSVTVRQPIRIIKTTFMQLSADSPSNIFSRGGGHHSPCTDVARQRRNVDSDSISPQSFIWEDVASRQWWSCCPIYSFTCHLCRQSVRTAPLCWVFFFFFFYFPQPVNTARARPLITIHLIRMQKTCSVSCDGRTGRLR